MSGPQHGLVVKRPHILADALTRSVWVVRHTLSGEERSLNCGCADFGQPRTAALCAGRCRRAVHEFLISDDESL